MLHNNEFNVFARSSALAIACQIYCNKVFPIIEFSARKGLEIIYKIPVDSVLYNSECHVSARSLRARCALAIACQIYCNKVFPI